MWWYSLFIEVKGVLREFQTNCPVNISRDECIEQGVTLLLVTLAKLVELVQRVGVELKVYTVLPWGVVCVHVMISVVYNTYGRHTHTCECRLFDNSHSREP